MAMSFVPFIMTGRPHSMERIIHLYVFFARRRLESRSWHASAASNFPVFGHTPETRKPNKLKVLCRHPFPVTGVPIARLEQQIALRDCDDMREGDRHLRRDASLAAAGNTVQ